MMQHLTIPVNKLEMNTGQIDGLPANPRQWTREELERFKKSLTETPELFEARGVLCIPRGKKYVVLGGNMRLTAAKENGAKDVPCIVVPEDTPVQKLKELVIKDNGTFGENDWDALANEWDDCPLNDWGIPAWNPEEETKETQTAEEDDFNEETDAVETRCKAGDIWQLGRHRLMCGDSTSAEDVAKLMNGEKADIVMTSPPYNAGSLDIKGQEGTTAKYGEYDDNKTGDEYLSFISTNLGICLEYANEVFYNIGLVSGNKREIFKLVNAYIDKFKDVIYWEKTTAAPCIADGVVNNLVEFILCFGHNNSRRFDNAQFSQGTYWNVIKGSNASGNEYAKIHKATFPVYLPENIITNFTPEGGLVLDTFGGTGTTMVAAEQLARRACLMELDPHYCDVILARWEKLTGQIAHKI